jgi:hypothetical protein
MVQNQGDDANLFLENAYSSDSASPSHEEEEEEKIDYIIERIEDYQSRDREAWRSNRNRRTEHVDSDDDSHVSLANG